MKTSPKISIKRTCPHCGHTFSTPSDTTSSMITEVITHRSGANNHPNHPNHDITS